ncbi:hypothetical protein V6N13_103788 [Hibiscus sabdariffa]
MCPCFSRVSQPDPLGLPVQFSTAKAFSFGGPSKGSDARRLFSAGIVCPFLSGVSVCPLCSGKIPISCLHVADNAKAHCVAAARVKTLLQENVVIESWFNTVEEGRDF